MVLNGSLSHGGKLKLATLRTSSTCISLNRPHTKLLRLISLALLFNKGALQQDKE